MIIEKVVEENSNYMGHPIIIYQDNGHPKFAGCPDDLTPKPGDRVEIFRDEDLSYRGISAVVVKILN